MLAVLWPRMPQREPHISSVGKSWVMIVFVRGKTGSVCSLPPEGGGSRFLLNVGERLQRTVCS
jgi:hypothetical protein